MATIFFRSKYGLKLKKKLQRSNENKIMKNDNNNYTKIMLLQLNLLSIEIRLFYKNLFSRSYCKLILIRPK